MARSAKAAQVRGALCTFLMTRISPSARINLDPLLEGITNANYGSRHAALAADVARICRGQLAQDAHLNDLPAFCAELQDLEEADDVPDEYGDSTILGWLRLHLTDEEMREFRQTFLRGGEEEEERASDEPPPFEGRPRPGGAMDCSGFESRYPTAALIGMDALGSAPNTGEPKFTTRQLDESREGFLSRFPDAGRIGAV